ncbi:MAG: hypothetical protein DMF96_31845 [Acidobacteria bacterium]|nr:MAG: hypothetical protein DMF96_31845 [Acidobacteriota bacterium]
MAFGDSAGLGIAARRLEAGAGGLVQEGDRHPGSVRFLPHSFARRNRPSAVRSVSGFAMIRPAASSVSATES